MTTPTTDEFTAWLIELEAAGDLPAWWTDTTSPTAADEAFVAEWAKEDGLPVAPDHA